MPVTAIIVGAGHRALIYAMYSKQAPDKLRIVGVADPDAGRREMCKKLFDIPDNMCFESADALAAVPKCADAVINGTMDNQHVDTAVPLLKAGYDMLLEKPFAIHEDEMWRLVNTAKEYNRRVMICHVLRYAPFYVEIKKRLPQIGKIMAIETTEHVSHHHLLVSFVRGKWRNEKLTGHRSLLLAKCCHDIDLIMWMLSGDRPVSVASFGGMEQFRPENAPAGSGTRCLVDCPPEIENECPFSARKQYLEHPDRWSFYVWKDLEGIEKPTLEQKEALLRGDSDFGRCAYKMDCDLVDNQTVIVRFASGAIASHNLLGGTPTPQRTIHISGTRGEIVGRVDDSKFTMRVLDPHSTNEYREEVVDLNVNGDTSGQLGGHAGGDQRLVADFVEFITGGTPSISCTTIDDSVNGHLCVFRADQSMEEGRVVAF